MILKKQRNLKKEDFYYDIVEIPIIVSFQEKIQECLGNILVRKNSLLENPTADVLTIVSSNYKVILHKDFVETVENTLFKEGLKYEVYDINEGGKNNNRLFINYILPSYKFSIRNDTWVPFVQGYNCYDKFMSYGLGIGLYNLNYESAFLISGNVLTYKKKHVKRSGVNLEFDMIKVSEWISSIGKVRRALGLLYESSLNTQEDVVFLIKGVLGNRKHFNIFQSNHIFERFVVEYGFTYYSLLLSLMYYVTHAYFFILKKRSYDESRNKQLLLYNKFIKDKV
uniref:Uncharacterized protein n=1 Tax=Dictyoglomus turgidum TaxID=513050 RepID=A0A7C3WVD9_9BACT